MKKTFLAIALATSVFTLSACNSNDDEVVVATKYGEITQNEFYEELKISLGSMLIVKQVVIEHILENKYDVKDEEIDERFNESKEQFGDSFELYLRSQGLTEEQWKENIRFQLLFEKAEEDMK